MMSLTIPMTRAQAFAAGAALVILVGCSKQAPEPEKGGVVARVNNVSLSEHEFKRLLQERSTTGESPANPEAVLQEWVDREVLVQNALKAGIKEDPKVQEQIRDLLIAEYKQRQLVPQFEAVTVTEEEVKTTYEEEKNQHITPERVRLARVQASAHWPPPSLRTRRPATGAATSAGWSGSVFPRGWIRL
jgi:hypothetical protein